MQIKLEWKEKMQFASIAGKRELLMDAKAPLGRGMGQTPKELLASSICGCTAMDVIALMRKYRQEPSGFEIKASFDLSEGDHPKVFTCGRLSFHLDGSIEEAKVLEAVQLSQTRFCGVTAMLTKAFPIHWEVYVNGKSVGSGKAEFEGYSN